MRDRDVAGTQTWYDKNWNRKAWQVEDEDREAKDRR
jgi:hypothetical protein